MSNAALYCRSSKDRSDVSIAAQKHELTKLAQARSLPIVACYEDAVQSGSTDDRPAFQRLIADVKNRHRGWSYLLVLDTSRVARGRFIAQAFKRQCAKFGVTILYAKMPETDPISTVILEAVFEAIDEVHSLMSREKGMAGMAENVRQGFRAGGRAPVEGWDQVSTGHGAYGTRARPRIVRSGVARLAHPGRFNRVPGPVDRLPQRCPLRAPASRSDSGSPAGPCYSEGRTRGAAARTASRRSTVAVNVGDQFEVIETSHDCRAQINRCAP
jgi:DNA invertase Pin-like site-specific DNA recombinase